MLGVFVSVLVLYVGAELIVGARMLARNVALNVAIYRAVRADDRAEASAERASADRARRAYAIRCSCDGRDQ